MFDLSHRLTIGIITGSGPEAGMDLWRKILRANKKVLGQQFQGDIQAPTVVIFSIPELGHSMELEDNYHQVWTVLKDAVLKISPHVDIFAIACNTLNLYADHINELNVSAELISTLDVTIEYIQHHYLDSMALLGALPVMEMGELSVFQPLQKLPIQIETADCQQLHEVIYNVKVLGADHPTVISAFTEIVDHLHSKDVLLACTELPLIPVSNTTHQLIDVTDLLANKLVQISLSRDCS